MKFFKNILVINMLLFFTGCTAWPALIPVPPGKKKTTIYPIPLPAQNTTTVANVRIADSTLAALGDSKLAYTATLQLKAIDSKGAEITSGITWSTDAPTVATVSTSGLVTTLSKDGPVTITATQSSTSSSGTVKITVSATGKSILAFDGKEFKEIYTAPNQNLSEEK